MLEMADGSIPHVDARLSARSEGDQRTEVVIIDAAVSDPDTLLQGMDPDIEIVRLDPGAGIADIAAALAGRADIDALHLISHGGPGALHLGGETIDLAALASHADSLAAIGDALGPDADLLLYGCAVGADGDGQAFVEALADMTGADVAASDDLTGAGAQGADWVLETSVGSIEAAVPLSPEAMAAWAHALATFDFESSVSGSGTPSISHTVGTVTVTISNANGQPMEVNSNANGFGNISNNAFETNPSGAVGTVTFSFSTSVDVTAFDFLTQATGSYDWQFTPVGGSGTAVSVSNGSLDPFGASTVTASGGGDLDWTGISGFTVSRSDGSGSVWFYVDGIVFEVGNSAPSLGGTPADATATEDVATAIDLSAYAISDPEGDTITLTLAVDRGSIASVDGNGTAGGVSIAGSGTASMTLQGTAAALNAYLDDTSRITFTTGANDTTAATLTVTPNDGTSDGSADTVTITITPVNDAPGLNAAVSPTLTAVPEDAGDDDGTGADGDDDATDNANNNGTTVASMVVDGSITDVDGGAVEAIAVIGVDNTDGVWQYSTDNGATWNNFSGTTGTSVDLSGAARLLDGSLTGGATQLVRFVPNADYSGTATLTFVAWDRSSGSAGGTADASVRGGTTAFSSTSDTASITVTAVNDAPVLTGLDGTASVIEGGAAVVLDADVTVADQELGALNGGAGDFSGATLTILRNGGSDASDVFSVASGGTLTVAGGPDGGGTVSAGGNVIATIANTGTGQIQITFSDNGTTPTTALVNAVLQAIRYTSADDDPPASVTLDWTLSDGSDDATGSVTVTLSNVNDAPVLTATGGNPTYVEGAGNADLFNTVTADTVEAADRFSAMTLTVTNVSDGASEILRFDGSDIALTNGNAVVTAANALSVSVSVTGTTATVSFVGATLTGAQLQTLVDAMGYRNASDNPTVSGNRVVTITGIADTGGTADGGQATAAPNLTSTVTLTAVNDPPVISSVFGETSQVTAGAGPAAVTGLGNATVTNVDSGDYNGGFLTLVQTGGTANGSWGVDGTTVTSGGDATIAAGETVQVGGISIGTLDATNDGQGGNDLRINLNGNASSARVETLIAALTYDAPAGLGSRSFTLTLADGDGNANGGDADASGGFTIDVTPNPPVIGNLDGDATGFTEGDNAVALDTAGNATVTDADSADFDGGDLTVAFQSGQQPEDRLVIGTAGTVSLSAGMAAGSSVSVGGTAIGTIQAGATGGTGEDLTITLNADATPARVQALLQALQYDNAGGDTPTPGARTIGITMDDGTGATSATSTVTVTVTAVNDVPAIAGVAPGPTIDDTATATPFAGLSFSDAESAGGTIVITYTGIQGALSGTGLSGSAGTYTLSGADPAELTTRLQALVFTPAENIAAPGSTTVTGFTLTPNDGTVDGTAFTSASVTVTSVNDTPTSGGFVSGQTVDDSGTLSPFAAATVGDADTGQTLSVTVTLDDATNGAFTAASLAASGFTDAGAGVYTLTGATAAQAQGALRALVFDPAENRGTLGTTETTTFTVSIDDGTAPVVTDATTTVIATSVNDDPMIGGTAANQPVTDKAVLSPFAAITVADPDPGQTYSATVTIDDGAKGGFTAASLAASGFADAGGGSWTLTGAASPAALQAALRALVFDPAEDRVALGTTETAVFTVSIGDGAATVADITTSVVVTPVNDGATIAGDTTGSMGEDADPNTVSGTLTATDPDNPDDSFQAVTTATASDAGRGSFTMTAGGTWTFTLDSVAAQALDDGDTVTDSFTVRSVDGTARTVTITITGSDDAPAYTDPASDPFAVNEDPISVSLLDGASDPEGAALSVANVAITSDRRGDVVFSLSAGGILLIDPAQFRTLGTGADERLTIAFDISDGAQTASVTREIVIQGTNGAPVAVDDTFSILGSVGQLEGNLIDANGGEADSDPDADSLTVSALAGTAVAVDGPTTITLPSGAVITIWSDGEFVYEPETADPLAVASDTFSYTISDGNGGEDSAEASIEIVPGLGDAAGRVVRISADDFAAGATVTGFVPGSSLILDIGALGAEAVMVTETGDGFDIAIDTDDDGTIDGTVSVAGVSGGGFLVSGLGSGDTGELVLEYVPAAPETTEEVAIDPDAVNGLVGTGFLTGDGSRGYAVTFDQNQAGLDSAIGSYVIGLDGRISDVTVLFDSTQSAAPGTSVTIDPLAAGAQLGFFLVAGGAGLSDADTLVFADPDDATVANAFDDSAPVLLADGVAVADNVFHTLNHLNEDDARMIWSGFDTTDGGLTIGFEDLLLPESDRDYNDVLISIDVV
jgi:VCBS repeat-containing protein